VAKWLCQNNVIFSSKGLEVMIMRLIHHEINDAISDLAGFSVKAMVMSGWLETMLSSRVL